MMANQKNMVKAQSVKIGNVYKPSCGQPSVSAEMKQINCGGM